MPKIKNLYESIPRRIKEVLKIKEDHACYTPDNDK